MVVVLEVVWKFLERFERFYDRERLCLIFFEYGWGNFFFIFINILIWVYDEWII